MNRTGLALVTGLVGASAVIGACSTTHELSSATMPPMHTTTTSTTSLTPTTVAVAQFYKVQKGDKLGNIAAAYHVSMSDLMAANGITNPSKIYAGQLLKIPANTVVIASVLPAG